MTAGADIETARVERGALVLANYRTALARVDLSEHSRRGYAARVARFLDWLSGDPDLDTGVDPLTDPHGRDFAVRDYRTFLKTVQRAKPATINAHLTALDHFYGSHLGLGPPVAKRERVPASAPQTLQEFEQRKFLRAAQKCGSVSRAAAALHRAAGRGSPTARPRRRTDLRPPRQGHRACR